MLLLCCHFVLNVVDGHYILPSFLRIKYIELKYMTFSDSVTFFLFVRSVRLYTYI